MAQSFFYLLGHAVVAADGFSHSEELIKALKNNGASKELLTDATEMMHRGEALLVKKTESCGEDRIREHGLHFASDEAEMWLESVRRKLKNSGLDSEKKNKLYAVGLHSHDHAVTVVARMIRAISTISTDSEIAEKLGKERELRDVLNRGNAALSRLIKTGEIKMRAKEDQDRLKVFHDIKLYIQDISKWMDEIVKYSADFKTPELYGWLGLVSKNVGIPVGGASFAVTLHERGQTTAPVGESDPCSGWSIGRKGNTENLGEGFLM